MIDITKSISCVWTNYQYQVLKRKQHNSISSKDGLVGNLINDFNLNQAESKIDKHKKEVDQILRNDINRPLTTNEYYMKYYGKHYEKNMRESEVELKFAEDRCQLSVQDRARMLDWMIEVLSFVVKQGCGTSEYTYFKAVLILDSCYYKNPDFCTGENLHILGVVAMSLASKYLDYMPIDMDFIHDFVVHRDFDKKVICAFEAFVLESLDMNIWQPTWIDFLDTFIYDVFGNYRLNHSIFHLRVQSLQVLHIVVMDPRFYNYGGMKSVCAAILVFVLRRNYSEYNNEITKQSKNITPEKIEELKMARIKTSNSENGLIKDVVKHSGVNYEFIEQIFRHIRKNVENLYQYKEKNIELGIKHIYTLFNNAK